MTPKYQQKRIPLLKVLKLSSLIPLVAVAACQTETPGLKSPPQAKQSINAQSPTRINQGQIISKPLGNGKAQITVNMHFENTRNTGFQTQAIDCTSLIADLRVKVIGLGIGELFPLGTDAEGYLNSYTAGECAFSATFSSVPVGNARIVTVEAFDINQNKLTGYSLSGLIDVIETASVQTAAETQTEISFRSTAAGMLAKSLVKNHGATGEALFSGMTAAGIQGFVDTLLFNAPYNAPLHGSFPNYTYETHPLLLNYNVLAQHLVDVNGDLSNLPTDPNIYKLLASRLNISNLNDTLPQTIRVSDPASQTFENPSPTGGDTSHLIQGILPGTWNVTVSNNDNVFNGTLSFAPDITTQITIGSSPAVASWTLMAKQPETANINAFQKDPVMNSNTHILGTTKGVYLFDTPESNQWNLRGLREYNILSVESGFDVASPRQNFFAGTQGKGLFKTTDSGSTWSQAVTGNGFDNLSIYEMHARANDQIPDQLDYLFAATSDGVVEYRLASEPGPWSKVNNVLNGNSLAGSTVSSIIETDPTGSPHLIITVPEGPNAGVYASQSANPGDGWYKIDGTESAIASSQPYRVSIDDQNPETLYVMGKNGAVFSLLTSAIDIALNIPDVSSLIWVTQGPLDNGYVNNLLAGSSQIFAATTEGIKENSKPPISIWNDPFTLNSLPNNDVTHLENLLGFGLTDAIAFTRGGIAQYMSGTWISNMTSGPQTNIGLRGADITALHADEITTTLMYVGTRHAGVFKYDDDSSLYERLPHLPTEASKEILDMDQDGTGNLLVLTSTGIYILNNPGSGGGTWAEVANFPSGFKASHLAVNPGTTSSTVYMSSAESIAPTGIYTFNCNVTTDCHSSAAVATWTPSYTMPVHSLFALGNTAVYAGAEDNTSNYQVIKTIDNGSNWDALNVPLNNSSPIDLLYSSGSRLVAVSTAEGTAGIHGLSTIPLGAAWVNLGNNLFIGNSEKINSLMLGGTDVYIGLSQGGIRKLDLSTVQAQWGDAQWSDFSQPMTNQSPGQYSVNLLKGFPAGNSPSSLWGTTPNQGIYRTGL